MSFLFTIFAIIFPTKNMNAKTVNLQECEPFGGGGFGTSSYNKTDDSVILKLNKASISEDIARKEFLRTKAVYDMGGQPIFAREK